MQDAGEWWYDKWEAVGDSTRRDVNADAINPGFWGLLADEMKLSRTDNPDDAHLLMTTGNCLDNTPFRDFIVQFGDFRTKSWADNQVRHTCKAVFGNNHKGTAGFSKAGCDEGEIIGDALGISFWADAGSDGAVMMIGGGGDNCDGADHGIGITETDEATFVTKKGSMSEADFGDDGFYDGILEINYALNLFVR